MCHIFILEVFEVLPDRSAPWHPRDPRQYQETEDGGVTAAYQLSAEKAYLFFNSFRCMGPLLTVKSRATLSP